MKIAVVSPGRSHLLDMSIMHIKNGHDVTFIQWYLKSVVNSSDFQRTRLFPSFIYVPH